MNSAGVLQVEFMTVICKTEIGSFYLYFLEIQTKTTELYIVVHGIQEAKAEGLTLASGSQELELRA